MDRLDRVPSTGTGTLMLRSFAIEGFKSIADRVEVELGRVNVFIGANASGKSALLEALGVLGAAASGRVDDAALLQRGVRPGVPALYKSALRGRRYRTFITLRANWQSRDGTASYEVGLSNPISDPEPAWSYRTESVQRDTSLVPGCSRSPRSRSIPVDRYTGLAARAVGSDELRGAPGDLVQALERFAIFSPTTAILRGIEPDRYQAIPVGLSGGRLAEALRETVRHRYREKDWDAVESFARLLDWVSGMSFKTLGVESARPTRRLLSPSVPAPTLTVAFRDRYMRRGRNQLLAYDASEGALYVLFLMVLALHPKSPSIFAVDNFDVGMNPRLARALTRALCEKLTGEPHERQVLLTTHNPLVLDGLDLRNDDIRLFAVERGRSGATTVRRITVSPDLIDDAKKGMTLSRLWVSGRLGAVPNV
jgi:predicted ATPase